VAEGASGLQERTCIKRLGVESAIIIDMQEVTKHFGVRTALRDVTLQLQEGRCLSLFGPNGAGKTTLLKILATLMRPSAGTVHIAGYDAVKETAKIRPLLGVVSHRTFLYGHLTAYENLWFYARLFGIAKPVERIMDVLHEVDLSLQARQLVRTYSRGMQQRLAIARAILHAPRILLLDEPYTGLDKHAVARLQALIMRLRQASCSVLLSTHDALLGLEVCDEIAIQCRGRIVYSGVSSGMDIHDFERIYSTYVG